MPNLQKEYGGKKVVWLTINSTNANHPEFKTPEQMGAWMKHKGGAPAATMLDRKVIDRLVRHLAAGATGDDKFALNVSARSIQSRDFQVWLEDLLRSHRAIAPRLVFEMAEYGVVRDIDAASRFAQLLRDAGDGAAFAMDNFGLHSDAFRCLETLRPSYVKLSRGFFDDLATNREDRFFISSIVKIAQPLQILVIAQAIEDVSLLPLLRSLGVDAYQGYATGKPARIA